MTWVKTFLAAGIAISAIPASGQEVQDYSPLRLNCTSSFEDIGLSTAAHSFSIEIPVPFHVTNAEKRLKFYKARIYFDGSEDPVLLAQPTITRDDLSRSKGPFGDLRKRAKDDDIPTTFWVGDNQYELQATSSFYVKSKSDDGKFTIDTDGEIDFKADLVTETATASTPAWAGVCQIDKNPEAA